MATARSTGKNPFSGNSNPRPTQAVNPAFESLEQRFLLSAFSTLTTLSVSAGALRPGQKETLTATVTTDPPDVATPTGGLVTFMDGTAVLGTAALDSGTAILKTTALTAGTHTLRAIYGGNGANFAGSATAAGPNSTITTIAGNGTAGFSGDGNSAIAAELNQPYGVAVDGNHLFIADFYNSRIRMVDLSTGVITTFAGTGTRYSSGDGGQATAADLGWPEGLTVSNGNLLFSDWFMNVVRKVDLSTGVISTVAGHGNGDSLTGGAFLWDPPTESYLDGTNGVAMDSSGNVYIALSIDNELCEVTTSNSIRWVAGNADGTAGYSNHPISFHSPAGLALDNAGHLFIADSLNNIVRELDLTTRKITTVAGNGNPGYSGDGDLATAANLYLPMGVAIDPSGNLLIADYGNNAVREVDLSTRIITTIAGTGTASFGGDGGPAASATLNFPYGVTADAAGDIFISDTTNNRVREITSGVKVTVDANILLTPTITAIAPGGTYNGSPFPATATVTDNQGNQVSSLEGVSPTQTYYAGSSVNGAGSPTAPSAAGMYTVVASFAGSANYAAAQSAPVTFMIVAVNRAAPTLSVIEPGGVFNGAPFDAYIQVAGSNGTKADTLEGVAPTATYYVGTSATGNGSTTAPSAPGTYSVVASFSGSVNYAPAQSQAVTFTITPANGVTPVVKVHAAGGYYDGQPYDATVTVNDADGLDGVSPTLLYYAGTHAWGTGSATAPSDAGTYTVVAYFAGSANFTAAQSAPVTFTIAKSTPTAEVLSTGGTYTGKTFPVTVLVTCEGQMISNPHLTGTFYVGNSISGTGTGQYPIDVGTYTLVVTLGATSNYNSTQSAPYTFQITQATPTLTVTAPGGTYNGSPFAATVSLTGADGTSAASLGGVSPTLTYYVGASASGQGSATAPTAPGTYTVTAFFPGSLNYVAVQAAPVTFTIAKATPTITVSDSSGDFTGWPYVATAKLIGIGGSPVASLDGVSPTLTYYVGANASGNGSSTAPTTIGTYTVVAAFAGSANYIAAQSAPVTFTITKGTPFIRVSDAGGNYTGLPYLATPSAWNSSGWATSLEGVSLTLTYYVGATASGAGSAIAPSAIGTYTVVASFAGSADYLAGQSTPVTFFINKDVSEVSLMASTASAVLGHSVTFTAAVSSLTTSLATATGTVDFFDKTNQVDLGTANLSGGIATFTTSTLALGSHIIIASYSGDTLFTASATTVGPDSIINTVVGNGTWYYNGDGGLATNAVLGINDPYGTPGSSTGMAMDAAGNLFITDINRVREVNHATGIITTIAGNGSYGYSGDGGPAVAARLGNPAGLAVDNHGHLFIVDADIYEDNVRIREVDLATGVITTVAGSGTKGYSGDGGQATAAMIQIADISGIVVDAAGNLFIADTNNNRIRQVNLSTGVITTIAGNGTQGFSGDGGQATAAELYAPAGLALDNAGHLFIADCYNCRIRKVDLSTGVISTIAGIGSYGYSGDGGQATAAELRFPTDMTVDNAGHLFIAEEVNNRVRRVDLSTGVINTVTGTGTAGFGDINLPPGEISVRTAIALDTSGHLYMVDAWNFRVRKLDLSSGVLTSIAGGGNGAVLGGIGDGGPADAATISGPSGVAVDAAGNLFIADAGYNRVREVNYSTGIITTIAGNGTPGYSGDGGQATAAELNYPLGLAVDNAGHLFVADSSNNRIREVDLSTGVITTIAGNGVAAYSGNGGQATAAALWFPTGVAVDGTGHLFIAEYNAGRVCEVNLSTGVITAIAGDGDSGTSIPSVTAQTGDGGPAANAELWYPRDVEVDGKGNLYIAQSNTDPNGLGYYNDTVNLVRKVSLSTGIITTVAGGGGEFRGDGGPAANALLWGSSGITLDASGHLFIVDDIDDLVRQVDLSSGVITTIAGNETEGDGGDGGPAIAAELGTPEGVAVDAEGNLLIADTGSNRIRKVTGGGVQVVVSAPTGKATAYVTVTGGGGMYNWTWPAKASLMGTDWISVYSLDGVSPTITYYVGATAAGAGSAVAPTQAGIYTAVAFFPGSANYLPAQSAPVTFTIDKRATAVTVSDPSGGYNGLPFTAAVTLTNIYKEEVATLEGVSPTVTYYVGSTVNGTGSAVAPTAPGTYTVVAYFPGSTNYFAAQSDPLTFTIAKVAPQTIVSDAGGNYTGLPYPATASVWSATGWVASLEGVSPTLTYYVGATASGAGSAVPPTDPGTYTVVASFAGNANYLPAQSDPMTFRINKAVPQVSITASIASLLLGHSVTFTARVLSLTPGLATPTGTMDFFDLTSQTDLGTANVSGGIATFTTSTLASGSHIIVARYSGNAIFANAATAVGPGSVIDTVAGNGTCGSSGDGGQATSAVLGTIDTSGAGTGIAMDAAGNLFITDVGRIREINHATGVITTIAGNGSGFSGDGGPAINAGLNNPTGVAVDDQGHLFIVEAWGVRIREVDLATGIITTIAGNGTAGYSGDGGQATAAKIEVGYISGLVARAGLLFIADTGNNRVREVNLSTGVITTIAGNGTAGYSGDGGQATAAELSSPSGLVLDAAGHLFIADYGNHRVRKVDLVTGIITTLAGNGTGNYAGAIVPHGDGGQATAAELYSPTDLAVDNAGHLFIAEQVNNRVREVNLSTGVISTVTGTGTAGFGYYSPPVSETTVRTGIAVDTSGHLYMVDILNLRVRELDLSSGVMTSFAGGGNGAGGAGIGDGGTATAASIWNPSAITVDAAGNIFISDSNGNRIREVNYATGVVTTVAGNGGAGYSGDGGQATAAELHNPLGLAVDNTGHLFIADFLNGRIREVDLSTGVITTLAAVPSPTGVTVDNAGHLFVAEYHSGRVCEVNLSTGVITTIAGDGDSASFWGNTTAQTGDGGPAINAELWSPRDVYLDGEGNLFIAQSNIDFESGTTSYIDYVNLVRKVNLSTGIITTVAGGGSDLGDGGQATNACLMDSVSISLDASGHLFIADGLNGQVREVDLSSGVITTIVGNGTAGYSGDGGQATASELSSSIGFILDGLMGLAVDYAGNLFIADAGNYRVREVTGGGVQVVVSAPSNKSVPSISVSDAGGTYNGSPYPAAATLTGDDGNPVSSLEGVSPTLRYYIGNTVSGHGSATAPTNAGTYTVVAYFAGSTNYAANQSDPVTFTIARRALTITANDAGKLYAAVDPAFSVTCDGFASGESLSNLGGTLHFATNEPSQGCAAVGCYQITPSGLTSGNYDITFAAGTLSVINHAPVLDNTGNMSFTPIGQDEDNNDGDTIVDIIASAGGDRITDIDPGALEGIAVVSADNTHGAWQYTIDGGTNWLTLVASDASARLLAADANTRIRFVPDEGFSGTVDAGIAFYAWDQTAGVNGGTGDASAANWTTSGPCSSAEETAGINVVSVIQPPSNHAPVLDNTGDMSQPTLQEEDYANNGDTVANILASAGGNRITDVDPGALEGIAVVSTDNTHGTWQFSLDGGGTWTALKGYYTSARLLDVSARIRFVPNALYSGNLTDAFLFRAWDQTAGVNGGTLNATLTGGTTSISLATESVSLAVTYVNHAPVLDSTGSMYMPSLSDYDRNNAGVTVASILASAGGDRITDVDAGAVEGIAVVATNNDHGRWQFSLDGGATWANFKGYYTAACLLDSSALIRLVPNATCISTLTDALRFRAWDETQGVNGGTLTTMVRDGSASVSLHVQVVSIHPTASNHSPVLDCSVQMSLPAIQRGNDASSGITVAQLLASGGNGFMTDVDPGARQGIAIVGTNNDHGRWQFSLDGGATWTCFKGWYTHSLLLDTTARIRFCPWTGFAGTLTDALSFRAWDQTEGDNGQTMNTVVPAHGCITSISYATEHVSITVA